MSTATTHLLVFDESDDDVATLRAALAEASDDFELAHASTFSQGVHFLEFAPIDAVLLDLKLGDIQGLETLECIRNVSADVPIVVLTSHEEFSVAQILAAGGQDIIAKRRLDPDTISRCIRHAIERQKAAAALRRANDLLERRAVELEHFNNQLQSEIDERRRVEAGLQAARQEAEAANNAKTEFLACMSHELRTPLNAIIGFSDGLLNRMQNHPLNDHQADRITKIRTAGQHLLSLINGILDVAKIESGEMKAEQSTFSIDSLVGEVVDIAEALGHDNQRVRFVRVLPNDLPQITTDRDKLKQILLNLISNAFKFTVAGSITLRAEADGTMARFMIEDTGIGIAVDRLHQIFDKFSQLDASTTREKGGTGLGLAICQSFTELLQGQLTVRSTLHEGSCFTLTIPLNRPDDDAIPAIQPDTTAGSADIDAPLVLCIDDSPVSQRMMQHFLISDDFAFFPAFGGEQGLKAARTMSPAAITLDVMMPDVDGWKVLRELKSDPQTRDIPVLLITSLETTDPTLAAGAAGCIAKPVHRDSLLAKLRQLTHRKERAT